MTRPELIEEIDGYLNDFAVDKEVDVEMLRSQIRNVVNQYADEILHDVDGVMRGLQDMVAK